MILTDVRTIEQVARSAFLQTWNVKNADGTAKDLTGWTGKVYVTDNRELAGTNQVDGAALVLADAANGVVQYLFTSTNTNVAGSFKGWWRIEVTDGTETLKSKFYPFILADDRATT